MSAYLIGLGSDMAIMSMLAISAYVMLLVGRISFGQQAFFGLGAYASGMLSAMFQVPLVVAILGGVVVAAAASWLLAFPTMKISGLHYAIVTLAFAEMARIALSGWHWQVPKEGGMVGPAGVEGFRDIRWLLENGLTTADYLLVTAFVLLLLLLVMAALARTRLGAALRMAGQDDTLASAQGYNVARVRLFAAALAGGIAGLGGAVYAHRTTYIEPAIFDPMLGVHAVGYALLGGLGTVLGPVVGVLIDLGLIDASRVFAGWRMVVFGGLVALFLRWRPRGLLDEALINQLEVAERVWRKK